MKVKCWGKTYEVDIFSTTYRNNGNYAVILQEKDGLPFATLTVNLYHKLPDGFAYVDTNNCPFAEEFIKENGLGEFTGQRSRSGYCEYPLYKFYTHVIPEVDG
jgi:hypothetical protein